MRFSGGACQPCKSRRKKCDGTTPICQRCAKAHRICFGQKPAFSTIHVENDFASGDAKRPRGPRLKRDQPTTTAITLSRDVRGEAIAYYMHQHLELVQFASGLTDSPREPLLATWKSSPSVDLALSSIALALFSNTRHCPRATAQASLNYRKSLQCLRTMLPSLDASNIDACLLTICLLSRYEDAILPGRVYPSASTIAMLKGQPHKMGLIAVLEHWRRSPHLAQNPTSSIKYARRVVRKAALLRLVEMPEWLADGCQFGECDHEHALDKIIIQIIRLRSAFSRFSEMDYTMQSANRSTLPSILETSQQIEQALIDWIESFPCQKPRTRHEITASQSGPSHPFFRPVMYSYPNHAYAAVRVQYYGYRLLLKQLEMRVLEPRGLLSIEGNSQEHQDCVEELSNLADELASTIPFCLGRFQPSIQSSNEDPMPIERCRTASGEARKPYVSELAVLPLLLASATPLLDRELREWFREQLADTASLLGYGLLEIMATTNLLKL